MRQGASFVSKGDSPCHHFSSLRKKGNVRFRLTATFFLLAQKEGKNALREKTRIRLRTLRGAFSLIAFSP